MFGPADSARTVRAHASLAGRSHGPIEIWRPTAPTSTGIVGAAVGLNC